MIRRGIQKFLSALLAAALCLTLLPVPAEAAATDRKPDRVIPLYESATFYCSSGNGHSYTWYTDPDGYGILRVLSPYSSSTRVEGLKPGRTQLWVQYTVTIPGYSYIDAYTGALVQMPPMDDYEKIGWLVEVSGEPCTVTFDRLDGSTPETRSAYKGGTVSAPSGVSRPGFLLDGWFTDLALTRRFDFSTRLTGDLILYARWNIARTVTFMSRGEEAEVKTVADGDTVSQPALRGPRGYVLTGWYTNAACTTAYDFSRPLTGNLTLYAGWQSLEEYTVSFDRLDGSVETTVICYSGETPPMPEEPVRDGYTFGGWYTDPDCVSPWTTGPVSGDLALYAGWTELPEERTVSFDSGGGTSVKPQTVLDGERATRPEDPEREGYTFEGWYAGAACIEPWDFESGVTEDLTLYAGWSRNEYTVELVDELVDPDRFTTVYERVWKTLTVTHGEQIEEPEGPPSTPDGYLFGGWTNDGVTYDFNRPVTENLRLVTDWVRPSSGSGGTNDGMDWNLTEDGVLSFSGSGGTGNYDMSYDAWRPRWYDKRLSILSIEVGEGAESAGTSSFESCANARRVSLPEGLRFIGPRAFYYCLSLPEICLPASLEEIGSNAFKDCESLRSIRIPERVTEIDSGTFSGCLSLGSAVLPEGLRAVGDRAFENCGSLRSIELPDGLESIGKRAFENCGALTELRVPGGVRLVSERAFESCGRLERLELAEGVEELGPFAFLGCGSLESVTVPKSLKKIGIYAFSFYSDWEGPLHIFYAGSREDWEAVEIDPENDFLNGAVIHYNCPKAGTLYPITFDSQGGSAVEGQLRLAGELLEEPEAPAREGYTFEGWYDGDKLWDFARDTAVGETILHACWAPVSHEVCFSGGDTQRVEHGETAELPAIPVLAGMRFNGWYTDPETTRLYLSGAPVTEDLTLYPGWLEERKEPPEPCLTAEWTGGALRLSGPPERLSALQQVWAASYAPDGRLTDLAAGQLDGVIVTFPTQVGTQWRLFLLDERGAPLGEGGTME